MNTKKKIAYFAALPIMALAIAGAASASAYYGWFGFGANATPQEIAQSQTARFQQAADLLGVNVDDIKNAWAQGKTIRQLAQEKGITEQQLQAKLQEQFRTQLKSRLQILVDQGVITQAQADQRLQTLQNMKSPGYGQSKGMGRGHGMPMGHMGMDGWGF